MKKQPLSLVLCCTLSTYQSKTVIHAALHLLLLKLDACIHRNELRFETLNLSIQMSDQWNQFNIYLIHHKLGQLKQKLWSRNMSALNTFQSPFAFNNYWWIDDRWIDEKVTAGNNYIHQVQTNPLPCHHDQECPGFLPRKGMLYNQMLYIYIQCTKQLR